MEAAEGSIIFIPAALARDSIFEAIDAGIKLIIYLGAIISGGKGTFDSKIDALRDAGVLLAELPDRIPALVKNALSFPHNRE